MAGDIVWINGPFPCGLFNDLKIFLECGLKDHLDEGERVEADDGYSGADPDYAKARSSVWHPERNNDKRNTVRARHETVNKRLKQFGALSSIFRHDARKHQSVFEAVAVLTQLSIDGGEPLFEISEYE